MKREDLREIVDFIQATGIVIQKLRTLRNDLQVGFINGEYFEFYKEEEEETKESLGKKCLRAGIEIDDIIKYLTHNQEDFGRG